LWNLFLQVRSSKCGHIAAEETTEAAVLIE
jgi:hypothetical protein